MNDFHIMRGIARLAEQLSTSREAPYCMQFTGLKNFLCSRIIVTHKSTLVRKQTTMLRQPCHDIFGSF